MDQFWNWDGTAWSGLALMLVLAAIVAVINHLLINPRHERAETSIQTWQTPAKFMSYLSSKVLVVCLAILLPIGYVYLSVDAADRRQDRQIAQDISQQVDFGDLVKVQGGTAYVKQTSHGCVVRYRTVQTPEGYILVRTNTNLINEADQTAAKLVMLSSNDGRIYCSPTP